MDHFYFAWLQMLGSLSTASIAVFLANGHHVTPASNSDPQTRRFFPAEAEIRPVFAKKHQELIETLHQ